MVSWTVSRGRIVGPAPFFVAGIVNVTEDSFYDGGQCATHEQAVAHGLFLLSKGAHILDIGGESTRPFAEPVPEAEEVRRVVPVVRELCAQAPQAIISIDTTKAQVALACLEAGACIVNDVSAGAYDPELLDVVCQHAPGYVLMHSQGTPGTMQIAPHYDNVLDELCAFFEAKLEFLVRSGLPENRIVLDPGIGFGKTLAHNLEILRHITRFHSFGRPLFLGISNKSLWGQLLGRTGRERNAATLAATALLYERGVRIHRVHEVCCAHDALMVAHTLA
ncbi:dihydropteroate synthase [Desulfovibrionales bacterium]